MLYLLHKRLCTTLVEIATLCQTRVKAVGRLRTNTHKTRDGRVFAENEMLQNLYTNFISFHALVVVKSNEDLRDRRIQPRVDRVFHAIFRKWTHESVTHSSQCRA